jgi:hypothetical protein
MDERTRYQLEASNNRDRRRTQFWETISPAGFQDHLYNGFLKRVKNGEKKGDGRKGPNLSKNCCTLKNLALAFLNCLSHGESPCKYMARAWLGVHSGPALHNTILLMLT